MRVRGISENPTENLIEAFVVGRAECGPELIYGFVPVASYLEMGDYAGFAASLIRLREYSSKHRISTYEYRLTSADAMRAILLGEFAEAERLADRALEIGAVEGDLATGVYGVQMFTSGASKAVWPGWRRCFGAFSTRTRGRWRGDQVWR